MMGRAGWSGAVLLAIGLAALVSAPLVAIAQTEASGFGVYAGKMYTLGGDDNAFAHNYDLQIADSAFNKTLSSSDQLVNMGTAVVGGLRMYLRF